MDDQTIRDLSLLRAVFPQGVPSADYLPLLSVLAEEMSERGIAELVAELVDSERVVVGAQTRNRPSLSSEPE